MPSSFASMGNPGKSLTRLLAQLPAGMVLDGGQAVDILGISIDSRTVSPGDLFVALRGSSTDGHAFVQDAVRRGAAAVVGEIPPPSIAVPYARLTDTRRALSWISAAFHGWPGRALTVIGVTGTDGKTTTATLIHRILSAAGLRAGLISTVNAVLGESEVDTGFHVTTPDAHDVQRYLATMVAAGLTHAVLETTSHGWAQHRIDACEFDIGVLTNITHEHLDEHGSFEAYRNAKARLFVGLQETAAKPHGNPRLAVLNRDDASFDFLSNAVAVNQVSYGLAEGADVTATDLSLGAYDSAFAVSGPGLRIVTHLNLPGTYNICNALAAVCATVIGLGVDPEAAATGLEGLRGVPGRMERIGMGQPFTAIVDFAHTPNALKVTLEAARALLAPTGSGARIFAVFGSAGLRDRAKRAMMAEVATELADISVLTAEDPRTESLESILAEMAESARNRGGRENETFWRIPDRGEAIRFAVKQARPGDVVLACGKGHEQSMCFGVVEYAWDDRTAMRAALAELLGGSSTEMPYLPTRDRTEAEWLR